MKKKVAIQGYEGCFHQIVAENFLGQDIEIIPCATFQQVARAVCDHSAYYGVMAIENSIAGSILPNLSILHNNPLAIVGEYDLHIRQHLMTLPDVNFEDIEEVHSHPMALLQCADYLDSNRWKLIETEDTALSAKMISQKKSRNVAAIAGELAAHLFGLKIITPDIHTIKNNFTRFLILRPEGDPISQEANKASLCFTTDHLSGSLMTVLSVMQSPTINMTKLQSSPIPSEPWHYRFHVDLEFGSVEEYNRVVEKVKRVTESLNVYGVYKAANNV